MASRQMSSTQTVTPPSRQVINESVDEREAGSKHEEGKEEEARRAHYTTRSVGEKQIKTACGHTVKISKVEDTFDGGKGRSQFRAVVSGPKITNNSGVQSVYAEASYEDVKNKLEKFFQLNLPKPFTREIGAKIRSRLRELSPEIDDIHTACGHCIRITKQKALGGADAHENPRSSGGQCVFAISGASIRDNSGIRSFYVEPNFEEIKAKLREHANIKIEQGFDAEAGAKIKLRVRELYPEMDNIHTDCGHTVRITKVASADRKSEQCRFVISGASIRNNSGIRSFYVEPNFEEIKAKLREHANITLGNGLVFQTQEPGFKIRQQVRELCPSVDNIATTCGHTMHISKVRKYTGVNGGCECKIVISGPTIRNNSGIRSFYSEPTFEMIKGKVEELAKIRLGIDPEATVATRQLLYDLWPGLHAHASPTSTARSQVTSASSGSSNVSDGNDTGLQMPTSGKRETKKEWKSGDEVVYRGSNGEKEKALVMQVTSAFEIGINWNTALNLNCISPRWFLNRCTMTM
jgi:hypothetical protein